MPYADPTPQYFPLNIPNNSRQRAGFYITTSDNGTTSIIAKTKTSLGNYQDEVVGEIPKNGSFQSKNASAEEIKYFSNKTNANKLITEQTVPMIRRSIGGQAGGGNAKINQILGTNLESVAPPTREEQAAASVDEALIAGKEGIQNISIPANYNKSYEKLYYPKEMETNRQDRIIFSMLRFAGSSIKPNFETGTQSIDKSFIRDIDGSVTLPIQPGITDNNSVDWSGAQLNAIQAYAAAASMRMIGSTSATTLSQEVGNILGKIAKQVTENNANTDALKIFFAQEAVGIQNLLSRTSGAVLNPNLELLFNGPSLRPFSFTFRLSPRDQTEAEQVRKIIRFFKQGMSVKTSSSNIFLQSPNIFSIRYKTFDGNKLIEHPSINRIKRCALLSCDVDYTPDGTYMTYNDDRKTLTSYQLSLRFNELEPVYEDDYGGAGGSGTTETTKGRPLAKDEIGY